jgi:hypothetical protein
MAFGGEASSGTMDESRGSTAMLYGAARGLVKGIFQHQVLLRQHFKAYVNWLSKARGLG